MKKQIEELKVLELASVLAGPSVGRFFAELGAQVTKVENAITKGDVTRNWVGPGEIKNTSVSSYYTSANYGKHSILLNYSDPVDFEQLIKLIKESDIIIVNFKYGDAAKFGLDFDSIKKINSDIVYGEITGFGPEDNRTAFDMILQAESGLLSINGRENDFVKLPVAFIDLFAGHQLKEGLLVALLKEQKGVKVTVSLFDSAVSSLANQAGNYLNNHVTPKPMGILHPNIAPYGEQLLFNDGKSIVLAIGSDKQFQKLCDVLDCTDIIPAYKNNQIRVSRRDLLKEALQQKAVNYSSTEFLEQCSLRKVPVAQIKTVAEVFDTEMAQKLVVSENFEGRDYLSVQQNVFNISY